ncbi:MAG: endonuclease/exonuclease/phosphatase family protein [Robiginitalea sp.]|uniref:endonuclease/exonuclease/phosphatase family protein n=1 Tax=Robiginitalea sp. TaxID=1902411 RepID=UPI003C7948A0
MKNGIAFALLALIGQHALFCQDPHKAITSRQSGKSHYLIRTIVFYNLENLFDTRNDSLTLDDDRTPEGRDHWTGPRLNQKLLHLSQTLAEIGTDMKANPPDIIGVCEVENEGLLRTLIQQPALRPFPYEVIHFDSPDPRGIDVGLLFREDRFFPEESKSVRLLLYDEAGVRKYTRDQLIVLGYLDTDFIGILVNHWPSRGGGPIRSREHRKAAALLQRHLIDSLMYRYPEIKIISMGDFNDDPKDASLGILKGKSWEKEQSLNRELYNPLMKAYRRGLGTLAYRDRWNLFDQILFSGAWRGKATEGYRFWKAGIFQADYLKTPSGRYQGYPFRTYAGGLYQGGYSDHFPVFAYVIRPAGARTN